MELKAKDFWEVNCGAAIQATIPGDVKVYLGPYFYYGEVKISPSANIAGLELSAGNMTLRNERSAGGFGGIEVPLGKGFRLNLTGQYAERFSAGAAVTFTY
jgi:hypothetical protein